MTFTTMHAAMGVGLLDSALGGDQGLLEFMGGGWKSMGFFRQHIVGPSFKTFNYGDGASRFIEILDIYDALTTPLNRYRLFCTNSAN